MADDFNWNSAVVLLNADKNLGGAQPILAASGSFSAGMSHSINYDSRQGQYEEKGGIDRDLTEDDLKMVNETSISMDRQLDYVSRMGAFSEKGVEEMIDCSFFGQDGPLSRDGIEAQLKLDGESGGCFYRSVLSVDRRIADDLNLSTKQDFERLLRDTWTESVLEWGITDNPNEVRWFANFHTDQPNNLHVHITTWFAPGLFLHPGWQVPAPAWREQREIINKQAYGPIIREHLREKDYCRDLAIIRARQELQLPVSDKDLQRLELKRKDLGREKLPEPHLSVEARVKLDKGLEEVRREYSNGHGRISRNYMLQASARKVVDELYNESPEFKEVLDTYRAQVNILADRNGLGVPNPHANPAKMEDSALKFTLIERNKFISQQMEDLKMRIVRPLIRSAVPQERDRHLTRESLAKVISFSELNRAVQMRDGAFGLQQKQLAQMSRQVEQHPEQKAEIITKTILESPIIKQEIQKIANSMESKASLEQKVAEIEKQVMSRVSFVANKSNLEQSRERGINYQIKLDQREYIPTRDIVRSALDMRGIKLGMSLEQNADFKRYLVMAKDSLKQNDLGQYGQNVSAAAREILMSPTMQRLINQGAQRVMDKLLLTKSEARSSVSRGCLAKIEQSIEGHCRASINAGSPVIKQTQVQPVAVQTPDIRSTIQNGAGDIVSAVVNGLMREASRQQRRPEQSRSLEIDLSRILERDKRRRR